MKEVKANVFIIEDDRDRSELLRCYLDLYGYKVVGEEYWVATAMNAVQDFPSLGVDVVTLDRDLYGGDVVAAGFLDLVRKTAPEVKTIGLSGSPITEGVDFDLGSCRMPELDQIIQFLLKKD